MIEGVKHLRAKFQAGRLGEFDSLQHRQVPVIDTGAAKRIASQVAMAEQGDVHAVDIGRIEVEVTAVGDVAQATAGKGPDGARIAEHLDGAQLVRPIQEIVQFAGVVVRIKREWIAGLQSQNPVQNPGFGQLPQECIAAFERLVPRNFPAPT